MPWYFISLIIIVVIAGIGTGILVSRIILKRQTKNASGFEKPLIKVEVKEKSQSPSVTPRLISKIETRKEKPIENQAKSITLAEDTLEKYVSKNKEISYPVNSEKSTQNIRPPVASGKNSGDVILPIVPEKAIYSTVSPIEPEHNPPAARSPEIPQKNAAIVELEKNLEIATQSVADKLINFQTDVWNTRRSEFNVASSQLLSELTEAYVDMLLANNIVWLVTELGRDSRDLRASYFELKTKVSERLKRILPQVKESLK